MDERASGRVDERASGGRRLAWKTAVFSVATGLSRILGLVREIVAAYYFGATGKINAFTVAFQVPNLIRSLVADAALSSAFVPVFSELLEKGERKRAWRVASTLFWLLLLGLGAITALLIVFAPLVIAPVRRPRRRQAARDHALANPVPDRRPARGLRDRRRDPQQLRALHGAGADAGVLEPRDHRRPRARCPARGNARHEALRLRGLDRDRDGDPGAAPAAVALRARRPPAARLRLARPGRAPGVRPDAAGDDRARPHQLQPRRQHALRLEVHRPGPRSPRDRRRLPDLHAPPGDVLGRDRDRALPTTLAPVGAPRISTASGTRSRSASARSRSPSFRPASSAPSSRRRSRGSSTSTANGPSRTRRSRPARSRRSRSGSRSTA